MIRKAVGAIVSFQDKYLLVHKININTPVGKKRIQGEWDFIKGGVNESDSSLKHAIIRELQEETGSTNYRMIEMYEDKLCFEFPPELQMEIGYKKQETTLFHFEYLGEITDLKALDSEIDQIKFVTKEEVTDTLTHPQTKEFFLKHQTGK